MRAKEYNCHVISTRWLTPSVISIRFEPSKKFKFEPGQFVSVFVPLPGTGKRIVKRCYSFSNSPEDAIENGYEITVKHVPGGIGSEFLSMLKAGDHFRISAPYGDFVFRSPKPGRDVCFIATGTGIGPFKSMVSSKLFKETFTGHATILFGARHESDILFRSEVEALGVEVHNAISQPDATWKGFRGRVTDFLASLPQSWPWHNTDFYICGNGEMTNDVVEILKGAKNVMDRAIHRENFSVIQNTKRKIMKKVHTQEIQEASMPKKSIA